MNKLEELKQEMIAWENKNPILWKKAYNAYKEELDKQAVVRKEKDVVLLDTNKPIVVGKSKFKKR
jgi:hypothetical protein